MNEYLLAREHTELEKSERRTVKFPNNEEHRFEMSALHWRWFDRLVSWPFGDGFKGSLEQSLESSTRPDNVRDGWTLGKIVAFAVERDVQLAEEAGLDVCETLEDIDLMMAKRQVMKFHDKKTSKDA